MPLVSLMTKPRMELYLDEAERVAAVVNAHRAAKAAAREEASLQTGTPVPDCNKANAEAPGTQSVGEPTPVKKKKSYPLPSLETPTPIDGFPFAEPAGTAGELPTYPSTAYAPSPATRVAMAERLGKNAPLKPSGPSTLRKKGQ
jgi:hypothetical protein